MPIFCLDCDVRLLDDEQSLPEKRAACTVCGSTKRRMSDLITVTARASGEAFGSIIPAQQKRDWKLRWKQLNTEILIIASPVYGPLDSDRIKEEASRLHTFLVSMNSLRDSLIHEPGQIVSTKDINTRIKSDSRLSLATDVANLEKHVVLTKQIWSGVAPSFGVTRSIDVRGTKGWMASVEVHHNGKTYELLSIAQNGLQAWEEALKDWRLI